MVFGGCGEVVGGGGVIQSDVKDSSGGETSVSELPIFRFSLVSVSKKIYLSMVKFWLMNNFRVTSSGPRE